MPGIIQVSVLELVDLPPSGQASSSKGCRSGLVSLKIAMGKTEFQTRDKGDFSFPVMSLRENLKLILLDADGNEISQTDVKTIIVVEKRSWDALFPLDGGGCVHLKVQFILNDEERKRICEMREAVLMRKHSELSRKESNSKDSVADARENVSFTSLRISQDHPQQPENHCDECAISQTNQNSAREINVPSGEAMDPQSRCNIVLGEIGGTSSSSVMPQEETIVSTAKESAREKFSVANTRKLISAFESISLQEQRSHVGSTTESWMRRIKTGGSSGEVWPEKNTENVIIQKMMPKSFSTGALPQMKLAPFVLSSVEVQKEEKHTDFGISKKKLGNNIESRDVQEYEKLDPVNKVSNRILCAAESPTGERTTEAPEVSETKEVIKFCSSDDIFKNINKHSLHKDKGGPPITLRHRKHEAPEKKIGLCSFPKGISFHDSESSHQNSNVTTTSFCEEKQTMCGYNDHPLHKLNKGSQGGCQGGVASFDRRQWVDATEIREDKEASAKDCMVSAKVVEESAITGQLRSSSMHQRQPKLAVFKAKSQISSIGDDVYEVSTYGTLDVKIDITYFDGEQCFHGSHGNSIPRHFCVTSGSKQLKDIIGGFISF